MKIIRFTILLIVLGLVITAYSCKKEKSCQESRLSQFNSDTSYIPYTGYETLTFVVKDSLDNILDTLYFVGKGKKKYPGDDGQVDFSECNDGIYYQYNEMDFVYYNQEDTTQHLIVNVNMMQTIAKFNIKYLGKNGVTKICTFEGLLFTFYNQFLKTYFSEFKSLDTTYYQVIQLATPIEDRVQGPYTYFSSYFGRYDGIIKLEETKNRIWYKIN
jgi:hypothetical protein